MHKTVLFILLFTSQSNALRQFPVDAAIKNAPFPQGVDPGGLPGIITVNNKPYINIEGHQNQEIKFGDDFEADETDKNIKLKWNNL